MGLCAAGVSLLLTGCGGGGSTPEPMPAAEIAPALTKAFAKDSGPLRTASEQLISIYNSKDLARAFLMLQELSSHTNLSSAQRTTVTRCLLTVGEQMQAAAAQGGKDAGEVMQLYRSGK